MATGMTHISLVVQENLQTPWAAAGCSSTFDAHHTLLGDMTASSTAPWVGALPLLHVSNSRLFCNISIKAWTGPHCDSCVQVDGCKLILFGPSVHPELPHS